MEEEGKKRSKKTTTLICIDEIEEVVIYFTKHLIFEYLMLPVSSTGCRTQRTIRQDFEFFLPAFYMRTVTG